MILQELNKSKSRPNDPPYKTIVADNFRLECNCRPWTAKKLGKPRKCGHTDKLVAKYGLVTVVSGDYYVVTNLDANGNVLTPQATAAALTRIPESALPPAAVVKTKKAQKAKAKLPEPVTPTFYDGIPLIELPDDTLDPYVDPMLAEKMPDLPDQKVPTVLKAISRYSAAEWVIEEKYDGHRVVVAVQDGVVRAWSRPKAGEPALVRTLPQHVADEFKTFPWCTIDGELFVPGGVSTDVTKGNLESKLKFAVFDVLRLMGQDTTNETLDNRRAYLNEIFNTVGDGVVFLSPQSAPSAAFVQAIFDRKGEGAILKRRAARYQPGARSTDWIKVKGLESELMTVVGFKKGEEGPYATVLLMNPKDRSTTKVKKKNNAELAKFEAAAKNGTIDSFIGRKLYIEYQFRTRDGGYRHPRWDRWENE